MSTTEPGSDLPHVWFHGGTLVLEGYDRAADVPPAFRWVKAKWRCPALYYPQLVPWLRRRGIQDRVPRWERLSLICQDHRVPHDYQTEAMAAWQRAGQRGSVVLPTGAGKTFIAVRAIEAVGRSSLIIAPTIDLLHQWYAVLTDAFNTDIGVYYGLEKELRPITVTTYHSAGTYIGEWGNRFKLLIFDEVHHLPAPSWREIALMSAAPFRLGRDRHLSREFRPAV